MARVWFIVAVLFHIVYAYENNIQKCDECMSKGRIWCKEPGNAQCAEEAEPFDAWCPTHREPLPPTSSNQGNELLKERRLYIDSPAQLQIAYNSADKLKVNVSFLNSTQTSNIDVSVLRNEYVDSTYVATIQAIPRLDFCSPSGGVYEYAYAKVTVEGQPDVTIKYHIACACMCSQHVEKDSPVCNSHGSLSCGACTCHSGWTGQLCEIKVKPNGGTKGGAPIKGGSPTKGGATAFPPIGTPGIGNNGSCIPERKSPKCNFRGDYKCGTCSCYDGWSGPICETQICEGKRGDIQCTNIKRDHVECSGNGYCGPCDTCVCYTDREGSQYFDEEEYCTDLCLEISSSCENCLINNTLGVCNDCNLYMSSIKYNQSLTELKDYYNRNVWVKCNHTVDYCDVTYWAMRDENNEITYMVQETCNDVIMEKSTAGPKVPIIMSVLALLLVVAAVGGMLAWKHFNAVPPMPLSDPEYQNIDAEDCTGENPLYKSPMSSFKNPTYGKW